MRDNRFKAVHRGGQLDLKTHHLLAIWAADCAKHVLPLFECSHPEDHGPRQAIEGAYAWAAGMISVGEARKLAVQAHDAARRANDETSMAVARAAGHAVATAHMADHAMGGAYYALRAVMASKNRTNLTVEDEIAWQKRKLPNEIRSLIESQWLLSKFSIDRLKK